MKLLSLHASNFKKLKFKQPLTFTEGIVLITGLNESGKSTILDAILYGLYGRMIKPNQKPSNEEIISYGSGEAQVRLEFSIGDRKYRVVREIHKTRANTAKLYEVKQDGALKNIATTVNETTEEIERLLGGITYNEIVASSVVAQKDLERLIKQRLDDRRKVINVFLNLDSFNKVQDSLGEERVRLEGKARTPGQLTVERQALEALTEQMKGYKDQEVQLSGLAEKVEKLKLELKNFEKQFDETDRLHRTLNEYEEALDLEEALTKEKDGKAELENSLGRQLASISNLRTELEQVQGQLKDYDGLDEVGPALTRAAEELEAVRESELLLNQSIERQNQLKAGIEEKRRELPRHKGPSATAPSSSRVWTYLAATGALGAGAVLSFFLSLVLAAVVLGSLAVVSLILLARQIASLSRAAEVSDEKQEALAGLELVRSRETELAEVEQKLSVFRGRVSDGSQQVIEDLRSIPRYTSALENVENAKDALGEASTLFETDERSRSVLEERAKLLTRQLREEPEIRSRLQTTREEIEVINGKLAGIQRPTLPADVVFSEDLLAETGKYRDSLNESVSRVRTQIEEATARQLEIKTFLEENKNIEGKVEAQQRKVRLLEKELAVVKFSVRGLEQTSESLRNRVKPQVERYMGLILPAITSGRYKAVELDDDYTVRVFDPEAGEFKPKEVFSGGTEDQLLLAMRLAFALALIPQAKGQSPEFLFLDEPLGSSDRIRREGIVTLLQKELSRNFKQIFLISHVGDLEAEADTIIQMENGTVREVIGRKPSLPQPVQLPA